MNLVTILKTLSLAIAMLLFNVTTLLSGASALASSSHQMTSASSHTQSDRSCTSSCATYPIKLEEETTFSELSEEQDHSAKDAPYYVQFRSPVSDDTNKHTHPIDPRTLRPPDLTTLYVNFRD